VALLSTLAVCFASVGLEGDAAANMAQMWHAGEGFGQLQPESSTSVGVASEELVFDVAPALDHADVTATYRLTNDGAATGTDIAFVVVDAESYYRERSAAPSVTVDGAASAVRVVTEAEVLGPALDAWLAANPAVDAELARLGALPLVPSYSDSAELRKLLPGCQGDCNELVVWRRQRKNPDPRESEGFRRSMVAPAAAIAIPAEVAKLRSAWSRLAPQRALTWFTFHVDFPAGGSRAVAVRYRQVAGSDLKRQINETFTYDYVLSPAKRWAHFRDFHLIVRMPPHSELVSSLPLVRDGDTYRTDRSTLPEGELSLALASRSGLWLGMKQPTGYWLILLLAAFAATLALSTRLGRYWGTVASGVLRFLGCVLGTGLAVAVEAGLVCALLSAAFPRRALGYGYEPMFGLMLAVTALVVIGIVVSGVVAGRTHRPSRAAAD